MCRTIIFLFVGLIGVFLSSALPAEESSYGNPAWQQAVEKTIESYIRSHPEVIEQSLQALETKRQEEEKERVKVAIATRQNDLLHDPSSPVSGNPRGDVTL